jgi:hypothetical protein
LAAQFPSESPHDSSTSGDIVGSVRKPCGTRDGSSGGHATAERPLCYFADLGQTSGRDRDVPTPDGVNSPVLGLIVRFKVKDDEAAN